MRKRCRLQSPPICFSHDFGMLLFHVTDRYAVGSDIETNLLPLHRTMQTWNESPILMLLVSVHDRVAS